MDNNTPENDNVDTGYNNNGYNDSYSDNGSSNGNGYNNGYSDNGSSNGNGYNNGYSNNGSSNGNGYNNGYSNNGYNNGYNNSFNNSYNNPGYYNQNGNMQSDKKNSLGIASMICGILSILLFCCCESMALTLGMAGVVLGIVSIKRQESSKGFAIAGIITGAIGFVFAIAIMLLEIYMRQTGLYDQLYNDVIRRMYESMGMDPEEILSDPSNQFYDGLH